MGETATMSDADRHRSTPGYVYGVAVHSSRQEEGKPRCACPCHVADNPRGATWNCDRCWAFLISSAPKVPYSHEDAVRDGMANPRPYMVWVPDYYFITKGNSLDDALGEHFKSHEKAKARAKELNDADVVAALRVPASQRERFDRYVKLCGASRWYSYDWRSYSPRREPLTTGRYAVSEWYDDGDSSWYTYETLAQVEEVVARGAVEKIVDLDSDEDVPFTRIVTVEFKEHAAADGGSSTNQAEPEGEASRT